MDLQSTIPFVFITTNIKIFIILDSTDYIFFQPCDEDPYK